MGEKRFRASPMACSVVARRVRRSRPASVVVRPEIRPEAASAARDRRPVCRTDSACGPETAAASAGQKAEVRRREEVERRVGRAEVE